MDANRSRLGAALLALGVVFLPAAPGAAASGSRAQGPPALGGSSPLIPVANEQAVLAGYRSVMTQALVRYRADIARVWPKSLVSSPTRWVEYSSDWQVRRVVDFRAKEIRISLRFQAGENLRPRFLAQLTHLLSEPLAEAYGRDPVLAALARRLGGSARPGHSAHLVLGALFDTAEPGRDRIRDKAGQLLDAARIDDRGSGEVRTATLSVALPDDWGLRAARGYREPVNRYAAQSGLAPAVIDALIDTESAFNPMAIGYRPAFGLMQIGPAVPGARASRVGERAAHALTPSTAFDPDANIRIGAAYLHWLYYREFSAVGDAKSRLYCALAAYVAGPGGVALAFNTEGDIQAAIRGINASTPPAVYSRLRAHLPLARARRALTDITARLAVYRQP